MRSLLKRLKIRFDNHGNTVISKEKFEQLIRLAKSENKSWNEKDFPIECYVLVDSNGDDFYTFPDAEIEEWEKDGSFEQGDFLYRMYLLRKI